MKAISVSILAGVIFLSGCAHSTMRGSVAMKVSDNEAHVCMGDEEVNVGDRVALYKNVCISPKYGINSGTSSTLGCTKTKIGEGQIERVLNEHYSIMKASPGSTFEEGTIVEKL